MRIPRAKEYDLLNILLIILGFSIVGVGVAGYINNNIIVEHTSNRTTYLVDHNGVTVNIINGRTLFDRYELTPKGQE